MGMFNLQDVVPMAVVSTLATSNTSEQVIQTEIILTLCIGLSLNILISHSHNQC